MMILVPAGEMHHRFVDGSKFLKALLEERLNGTRVFMGAFRSGTLLGLSLESPVNGGDCY